MSRTKIGIAFVASLAIGSAAVALEVSPVHPTDNSICACTACDADDLSTCHYKAGEVCYVNEGHCAPGLCNPGQKCLP